MAGQMVTKSNDKTKILIVAIIFLLTSLGCSLPLSGLNGPDPTLTPAPQLTPLVAGQSTVFFVGTQGVIPTPIKSQTQPAPILYYTQSGDTLAAVAIRFAVNLSDITSPEPFKSEGFLKPGQLLVIPKVFEGNTPDTILLPDSEVVYSPASLDFNLKTYVKQAGGYLSKYTEYLATGLLTGAEVVEMVATDHSINPRLLLAILEYQSKWVSSQPGNLAAAENPLGYYDPSARGLFNQLSWAARQLQIGYYGWRSGSVTWVTFPDNSVLRPSPEINAGTAALQTFFSRLYNQREWNGVLYAANGFLSLYEKMFGTPWSRAEAVGPLFTDTTAQPTLDLPFSPGRMWSFSGGPHAVWGKDTPLAALDFAPASTESGCALSQEYVLAPSAGLVLRSGNGVVVVDLDSDSHEQTGWVLFFLHIRTEDRVPTGTRLNKDDPIGHPSCEGGAATGTHVHFARKYNGEWIPADGPLPFILSGWRAFAGAAEYQGTLKKNVQTVTAMTDGSRETQIIRLKAP